VKGPSAYLKAALESVNIVVHSIRLEHYQPETFGSLVARAETGVGILRIVYDRGFYVETGPTPLPPDLESRIVAALETHKRESDC
jgi:TATA-box binding protein (TBP) (component of TFIID and TFIIIB)